MYMKNFLLNCSRAKKLKKDEYKIWDKLIDISIQGTIFHKLDW